MVRMSLPSLSPSQASLMLVESARYALMRRLAFAIRHELVVHFQPIGMLAEVMERRLRTPDPDLAQLHQAMVKIQGFSKQAALSCLDVITWLSPDAATVPLSDAIDEVMRLLRSNLSFRGFQLRTENEAFAEPVQKAAARMLLPACLLALSDETQAPADLVLKVEPGDGEVTLDMRVHGLDGEPGFPGEPTYRPLGWHEVDALARAENMTLERGTGWARLSIPL
jgi:hypothetical protein